MVTPRSVRLGERIMDRPKATTRHLARSICLFFTLALLVARRRLDPRVAKGAASYVHVVRGISRFHRAIDGSAAAFSSASRPMPAWSPHLVDCRTVEASESDVFVNTTTKPWFLMNIHDPKTDVISQKISEEGCWECDHIKGVRSALLAHPDAYFLDVGGNIGMWSLSAAALGRESFTIEPNPENYRRICKTINKNNFASLTHVLRVAATNAPANLTLRVPLGNKGGGRVSVAGGNVDEANITYGVPIDMLRLPTDRPLVLKVDVEGFELDAMAGGLKFLKNATILYAAMELRPHLLLNHRNTREIFNALSSNGLAPYRVDHDRETRLDPEDLSQWKHFKHPAVRYFDVFWRRDGKGEGVVDT